MLRLPTVADIAARIRKDRQVLGGTAYALDALVLLTFLALIAVAFPRYIKAREGWREDEVRANLKVIQVALERYAVDQDGEYPLILYGGHPSDTFATTRSSEVSEFPGDVDWLMEDGYLAAYPFNPFRRQSRGPLKVRANEELPDQCFPEKCEAMGDSNGPFSRVSIWWKGGTRGATDRSDQWLERRVGGPRGDLMWDVSEGQRHTPFPVCYGSSSARISKVDEGSWRDALSPRSCELLDDHEAHTHFLLPGNFYYLATFTGLGNYNSFEMSSRQGGRDERVPIRGTPTGYTLFGYGNVIPSGHDHYNHWGDTVQRNFMFYGFEVRFNMEDASYYGPDGRQDGVLAFVTGPKKQPSYGSGANDD